MQSTQDQTEKRIGILQVSAGAFLISFSAVFVKLADVGPTAAGFYRMIIGGAVLLLLTLIKRDKLWFGARPAMLLTVCGVLFALDLAVWHQSIRLIGPGLSTLLGNFQVIFLAAFGVVFLGEKLGWRRMISIPLAILGLTLIVIPGAGKMNEGFGTGVALGILTAVLYATFLLILRRVQSERQVLSPLAAMAVISLVAAPLMALGSWTQGEKLAITDAGSLWAMIGYGLLCQAAGWVLITRGLPRIPASRAGLLLLLQPVLTLVWDYRFFAKPVLPVELWGAALALGAIYLGSRRREVRPAED